MIAGAQIPSYVPANGLSAWYSFDENTNDESGNDNLLLGAASYTTGHIYPSWAVTNFQASDPLICETPSFIFGRDSSFTLSCWIKAHDSTSGGMIVKHWNQVTSDDFDWFFGMNINTIAFACGGYGSAWTTCQYEESVPLDTWIHLIASYDNGTMNLYLNSALVAFNNFTDTATTSQLIFRVGHDPWSNSVLTDVDVDDMGIWNRVLSSTERQDLYESVAGVNDLTKENKISLYPNPSNGKIILEIKDRAISFKEGEIIVFNSLGENIFQEKLISEKIQIDLSDKVKGVYFIKIQSGQTILTKKIVIE